MRQSGLEFDRRLHAAAQARVAEVANELLADLEAEHPHPEKLERLPGEVEEAPRTTTEIAYARVVDRLHGLLRQF